VANVSALSKQIKILQRIVVGNFTMVGYLKEIYLACVILFPFSGHVPNKLSVVVHGRKNHPLAISILPKLQ